MGGILVTRAKMILIWATALVLFFSLTTCFTLSLSASESGKVPGLKVEKYVSDDGQDWRRADSREDALKVAPGAPISWMIMVENRGNVTLTLTFSDTLDGQPLQLDGACGDLPGELGADERYECIIGPVLAVEGLHVNQVLVKATHANATVETSDRAYYLGTANGSDEDDPDEDCDGELAIEVEKSISADGLYWKDANGAADALKVAAGAPISWMIEIENEGSLTATLAYSDLLDDIPLPLSELCTDLPPELSPEAEYTCIITATAAAPGLHVNRLTVTATHEISTVVASDAAFYVVGAMDEGCGAGYWKTHPAAWEGTGYKPTDSYSTTFGVTSTFSQTLMGALQQGGGGEMALGRQAVAALLNAVRLTYPFSATQVIDMVQGAYATGAFEEVKEMLEEANEAYCPLGGPADPGQPGVGTPKFWKEHPEAWPVDDVEVGHRKYAKQDALTFMHESDDDDLAGAAVSVGADVTYDLFSAAVAAKLNVAAGAEAVCIGAAISAADAWLAANPVGSGVSATDPAWQGGAPLLAGLSAYNNGALCAPARVDAQGVRVFLPLVTKQ